MSESVRIRSYSSPYFLLFGLNTEKYGPEKTPYLETYHTVNIYHDPVNETTCLTDLVFHSLKTWSSHGILSLRENLEN